jgi:hypothetical protein
MEDCLIVSHGNGIMNVEHTVFGLDVVDNDLISANVDQGAIRNVCFLGILKERHTSESYNSTIELSR